MRYHIKGYTSLDGNNFEYKFEAILPSFEDVVEFISRVSFENYERITILPEDYKEI